MMDILTFVDDVNDQLRRIVNAMEYVPADALGLDRRAGYRLFVNDDCIVTDKDGDRTLQYYGGFEYVDKDYRIEMGDYVIYLGDDERVRGCIDSYYDTEKEVDIDEA
jgi:hypothetical protein